MNGPTLPWSDPDRDIAADMVESLASKVYHHLSADAAAESAAQRLRMAFAISEESVRRAAQTLRDAAAGVHDALAFAQHVPQRCYTEPVMPDDRPAWKRMPRSTWHGGPVTHEDLDVDLDHVADVAAAQLDYLAGQRLRIVHHQTGVHLHGRPGLDYHREQWSRPRQAGKTSEALRDFTAWCEAYLEVTGEPPVTMSADAGHPWASGARADDNRHLSVQDILDQIAAQEEAEQIRSQAMRPYLQKVWERMRRDPDEPRRVYDTRNPMSPGFAEHRRMLYGRQDLEAFRREREGRWPDPEPPPLADWPEAPAGSRPGRIRWAYFLWTDDDGTPRDRFVDHGEGS
jgi:hypothetical protein